MHLTKYKLFESNNDKLWSEIDLQEFYRFSSKESENFTEKEVSEIFDLVCKLQSKYNDDEEITEFPSGWSPTYSFGEVFSLHFNICGISHVYIHKFEDEWFTISETWIRGEAYYLGDQFQGLLDAIEYIYENV